MANLSPVSSTVPPPQDFTAPAPPIFKLMEWVDPTHLRITFTLPTTDVGGGPLTGLAHLYVAHRLQPANTDPWAGDSGINVVDDPTVQISELGPEDAGTDKIVNIIGLTPGQDYSVAAVCGD